MERIMYKSVIVIFSVFLLSCNSYIYVNNNSDKFTVKIPENAISVKSVDLKGKYSDRFYFENIEGEVYTWANNYYLNDDIIFAFDFMEKNSEKILTETEQKERTNAIIYLIKTSSNGIFSYEEKFINNNEYLLLYFQRKNNNDDYFVNFETVRTKPKAITGLIRFPATMSLEEIEKRTIKILSGVKLKN